MKTLPLFAILLRDFLTAIEFPRSLEGPNFAHDTSAEQPGRIS
jgi:hypothetical protein